MPSAYYISKFRRVNLKSFTLQLHYYVLMRFLPKLVRCYVLIPQPVLSHKKIT